MDKDEERKILEFWEKKKIYEKVKKKNKKGKDFYFLQGPPYTSGRLHIGHAWNNSLKDLVLRYKRMKGFNVWDRAGYDMHGLPTENAVQKKLKIKDKLEIEKYGVSKFIKECIKFSTENAKIMNQDLERLGVWMDFENAYLPIKDDFIEGEWWLIKQAWKQKRLYKGKKIMHWCKSCETSLAKHEIEYNNVNENSIYLKFKIKNSDEYLIVWTTTPWTIPYNLAVMVHPDIDYVKVKVGEETWILAKKLVKDFFDLVDKKHKVMKSIKGKELEGLHYEHPFNKELENQYKNLNADVHKVILSKDYVSDEDGSGLVHSAPGCGPEDFEACQKYEIPAFNNLDEKGVFQDMNIFTGLRAKDDDKKFIEKLKEKGSLIKEKKVEHEYPYCWRCHNPVVFRATEQWFMKIEDLIKRMLEFNKKVKWNPNFTSKNYDLWTKNLKDNGITRQRYWGCPLPIWQCECGEVEVIQDKQELKKKAGKIPENLHKPWIDEIKIKCKCGKEMSRVEDIIDVWVDAGTASWNCLYYPKNKKHFKIWPADFILEATEQVRLWYSMLQICSVIAFNKSAYKNVYSHGMILDYQGMKMSKSLGNIISPYEVVDKYGADILRYYMCGQKAGENFNFNWEDVKIKKRNLNVLYNLSRFLIQLDKNTKPDKKQDIEEKYIFSRMNSTIDKVSQLMEEYRIDEIVREVEELFLDLSRVYIQFTREKMLNDSGNVLHTIKSIFPEIVKMFSIVCPFLTEKIWQELREEKIVKEESVHLCSWPKSGKANNKIEEDFEIVKKIIEAGLAERDKKKVGLKWPLASIEVNSEEKISKELQEIITRQLNVKKIKIRKGKLKVKLDTKQTPELEGEGFAREISRKVQSERKKQGLVKKDLICLEVTVSEKLKKLLNGQEKFIKERTNSKTIEINEKQANKFKLKSEHKIKQEKVTISFKKG